ncbi:MAG: AMIN domain-containing protein [Alphaproteobacteria bacterium]|nr:AMIN domain-containing protein [Alphaproteobacteria bacterium]
MIFFKTNRLIAFFIGLIIFFTNAFAIAGPVKLSEIRIGRQDEKTIRLVAHLDDKNPCKVFTLENPTRIVFDFQNTQLDKKCLEKMPKETGFIKDIRIGEPVKNQTRIVLETTTVPSFDEAFYLSPTQSEKQWRYVIDLKQTESSPPPKKQSILTPISASTSAKQKLLKPLIVLDPGHGGSDPGAISVSGKYEKNLTLKMAQETKKALEKTGKYRVLLTRDKDKALALRERINFAHKNKADLFISIHADSAKNKKAKGLSVYTISEKASDREAQLLAERENKADIILGIDLSNELPEVSNILIDLAKRDTMEKSAHYANLLVNKMAKNVTLLKDAHRYAGFVVLKSPNIPSVLIEIGYLSNKQEEKLLQQQSYRTKLANSIVQAVNQYFDTIYE